jgi:hypothetical protein
MLEVLLPVPLPGSGCLELQTDRSGLWIQEVLFNSEEMAVLLATTSPVSTCPICNIDSTRVHIYPST